MVSGKKFFLSLIFILGAALLIGCASESHSPVAIFAANPNTGDAPLSVQFTDLSEYKVDTWQWDFGDGSANSNEQNPTHIYTSPGAYSVTFTVFGPSGADSLGEIDLIKVLPSADFTATPANGDKPLTVDFTDASTGVNTQWEWDFGDGTPISDEQNPTHVYADYGLYTVELTVTGPGGSKTETKVDFIEVVALPVADFTATPTFGDAPLNVQFTDTSTGQITAWEWDFEDDGNIDSNDQNPSNIYTNRGDFTVTLTVTGPGGTDTKTITDCIAINMVYVDDTNGSDSNDGKTALTPVKTIKKGIEVAGQTNWMIKVADGTYIGADNKNLDFGGKQIHLKSRNGYANCIIDCENSGRGVYFHTNETQDSILEGFTIKKGRGSGGGIYCDNSSPTIINCKISDGTSSASSYQSAYCSGIYLKNSNPAIKNCIITNNKANGGNYGNGYGGGIYCTGSNPTIQNCKIYSNTASGSNYGDGYGGGIYCTGSNPMIQNCLIYKNTASGSNYGDGFGGGIYCSNSKPSIQNCTISTNRASGGNYGRGYGGGIYSVSGSELTIHNTIVFSNSCSAGTFGSTYGLEAYIHVNSGVIEIKHSNFDTQNKDINDSVNHINSNLNPTGFTPGSHGNLSSDPLFTNAAGGDYHLQNNSPCIDAGDNALVPIGLTTDLDGNARIVATVDMGAYEKQ
ncbi:MAG: PKD domain-containing protein [Planctomycetes bacterium]|nr:PKD domain-containing protein [Planctomycetota bacterium]